MSIINISSFIPMVQAMVIAYAEPTCIMRFKYKLKAIRVPAIKLYNSHLRQWALKSE